MSKTKDIKKDEDDDAKGRWGETFSTVLWALGIAFVMRTFVFQPFHIPSGSMYPGLMAGDYIITSKYSVGYGRHAATPFPFPVKKGRLLERELDRGDVIVFRPEGGPNNYIKRIVGLPGDQVQMKDGLLHINGTRVPTEAAGTDKFVNSEGGSEVGEVLVETFPNGTKHQVLDTQKNNKLDNTDLLTVPAGHYFMMGDNRDHSLDSRVEVQNSGAGLVPKENIIGKAEIVLLSVNEDFTLLKPWTWLNMRGDRWFKGIK